MRNGGHSRSGSVLGSRAVLLAGLFLATVPDGRAQDATIRGRVVDGETGEPLQGVNVFIAHTLHGAATEADGRFAFRVPPGTYELVASMIGYESHTEPVRATPDAAISMTFTLAPVVYEGQGLVVTAEHPRVWRKHLRTFTRQFLSTTPNADACEILNPLVLDFSAEGLPPVLEAVAREPLLVENRALGYRVTWVLNEFVYTEHERQVRYAGRPFFEELIPESDRQRRSWEDRRRTTYEGSLRHFLTALAEGRTEAEGFRTRLTPYPPSSPLRTTSVRPVDPSTLVRPTDVPYEYLVSFTGSLEVTYRKKPEQRAYLDFVGHVRPLKREQISYLVVPVPARINARGYFNDTYAARVYGYWGWERAADLLPLDYTPDR